jgi:hypothetical protein
MKDLASNTKYKLILEQGTAYVDYFASATKATNPEVASIWARTDISQLLPNAKVIEERLLKDSKLVYFGPQKGTAVTLPSVPCNITSMSPSYMKVSIAWAHQKGSPYVPLFNFHLTRIRETGQVIRTMTKYTGTGAGGSCNVSNFKPIVIQNIFTAFLTLLVGVVVALILLGVEKFFPSCYGKYFGIKVTSTNEDVGKQIQNIK